MTDLQTAQVLVALLVALTPLAVVAICERVAAAHARGVRQPFARPRSVARLAWITAAAVPIAIAAAAILPPAWTAAVNLFLFASLSIVAMRALGAITTASQPAREAASAVRMATLKPRRVADCVPTAWRVALASVAAVGLAVFAWRAATPADGRRWLVPVVFAVAAPIFLWLYEGWLRDLITGGDAAEAGAEQRRRRIARAVFGVEVVLVAVCLTVAHLLLDLDWHAHAVRGVAGSLTGAVAGIAGCALAISSGLAQRRYVPPREPTV